MPLEYSLIFPFKILYIYIIEFESLESISTYYGHCIFGLIVYRELSSFLVGQNIDGASLTFCWKLKRCYGRKMQTTQSLAQKWGQLVKTINHWNTYQNLKVVENVVLRWVFTQKNKKMFSENICKYLKFFLFILKNQ